MTDFLHAFGTIVVASPYSWAFYFVVFLAIIACSATWAIGGRPLTSFPWRAYLSRSFLLFLLFLIGFWPAILLPFFVV